MLLISFQREIIASILTGYDRKNKTLIELILHFKSSKDYLNTSFVIIENHSRMVKYLMFSTVHKIGYRMIENKLC